MKKIYISPRLFVLDVEPSEMLKGSNYTMKGGTQWGGEGEYAPGEWINEGQQTGETGGYTTTPIGDDEWDLPSRAKGWGDLWDWD